MYEYVVYLQIVAPDVQQDQLAADQGHGRPFDRKVIRKGGKYDW